MHTMVAQKIAKLQTTPTYDPFVSGELATSARFLFELMQQSGLNTLVSDHIKANGLPAYNPSTFQSEFDVLSKAGVKLSTDQMQALFSGKVTSGEDASAMLVRFNSAYSYEAFNVGLYNLMKRRSADPALKVDSLVRPVASLPDASNGDIEPTLYTSGDRLQIHPRLLATANDSTISSTVGGRLEAMTVSPLCANGPGGGGGRGPANSDGGDNSGYTPPPAPGTPGSAGDPDTAESDFGDVLYEDVKWISAAQACSVLQPIEAYVGLASALSAAAVGAWIAINPGAAAAFAADLGFASAGVLTAFLVGIGLIATFYSRFCPAGASA